jgi:hypothetical protein
MRRNIHKEMKTERKKETFEKEMKGKERFEKEMKNARKRGHITEREERF